MSALLLFTEAVQAPPAESTPGTAAVRTHIERYAGRYRDDPRFRAAFRGLTGAVARGLSTIEDRLGLEPKGADSIHIHVADADPRRYGHDRARCRTQRIASEEFQRVELFAEYFVSGDATLDTVVTHELVHAVMRERMSCRAYERLPRWLREGLAVRVADEGERHLHRTLLAEERVDALMTGLVTGSRGVRMYPYSWLAVEYIVSRGGAGSLARLGKGLVAGRNPPTLIARICRAPWATVRKNIDTYARRRIQKAARGLPEIKRARRLFHGGHFGKARAACTAFLKARPDSAFAPTARYLVARSWFKQGRFDRAESGFRTCLTADRGVSGWVDECHLFLGIALIEQARREEGLVLLRDYLELHPYATQRDLGWLALGRALAALERGSEAKKAFAEVARVPGARSAHRAAAARELARRGA